MQIFQGHIRRNADMPVASRLHRDTDNIGPLNIRNLGPSPLNHTQERKAGDIYLANSLPAYREKPNELILVKCKRDKTEEVRE